MSVLSGMENVTTINGIDLTGLSTLNDEMQKLSKGVESRINTSKKSVWIRVSTSFSITILRIEEDIALYFTKQNIERGEYKKRKK